MLYLEEKDLGLNQEDSLFLKFKQTNLWYIIIVFVLLVSIGVFILRPASSKQIAMAESTINSFYQLESNELKSPISLTQLDQAATQLEDLPYRSKTYYLTRLNEVEQAYEAISNSYALFEAKEINGQTRKVLADFVDYETLKQGLNGMDLSRLPEDAQKNYQSAQQILDDIQTASVAFKELPQDIKVRGDAESAAQALVEYEENYKNLIHHPQANLLKEELHHYGTTLGEYIKYGLQFGDYSLEAMDAISQSEFMKESLRTTVFDKEPRIALTFDDGPNPDYTPKLLDILAKHGVKGTFFVMGAYVDEYPEIARRIVEEGHMIANHTYNHLDLATLSNEEILTQIEWTQDSIFDETGILPTLYRMPFGSGGSRVVDLLENEYNMTSILWNLDTMDWSSHSTEAIREVVRNNLSHHTLLLMHDTHPATPESIDLMIPKLKEAGYTFVFADEIDFDQRYFEE